MGANTTEQLTIAKVLDSAQPQATTLPGPDVYRAVARKYLPLWRATIGSAPWLKLDRSTIVSPGDGFVDLANQIAAATAIGLYEGTNADAPAMELHREQTRATLVLWQSYLGGDGMFRMRRDHPLGARMASQVVQLLCEVDGYAEPLLLADVSRHLDRLARQPKRACWLEAAAIVAMADGAVLLRRTELLGLARERLARLLARQTIEGWFPENGGADVGLLSLTIDALARVYHHHNWDELTEPLTRSLRFLRHFVTPSGLTASCGVPLGTGVLSPYGLELLAPTHADANALALILRRRYAQRAQANDTAWSKEAALGIGPSALLAARHGNATLHDTRTEPLPSKHITRFERADLTIVETRHYRAIVSPRHGGALWVWWSNEDSITQDTGVCVIFPNHTRVSGNIDRSTKSSTTNTTITCGGVLRRLRTGSRSTIWRWLRQTLRPRRSSTFKHPPLSGAKPLTEAQHRALLHDYFRREMTFHEDTIVIRDEIICRTKCEAIVCGSDTSANPTLASDVTANEQHTDAPLYLRGGKHTAITRTYENGALSGYEQRGLD